MTLPNVTVPDISAYQGYLPDGWNAELVGGSGSLNGAASISAAALDFDLTLSSDKAAVKFSQNVFESGLVLGVKAKGAADATTARVDVAGTYVELDDSRVKNKEGASTPWQTRFAITAGEADFVLPEGQDQKTGVVGFWSLFQDKELKSMLGDVNGRVEGSLNVSDLDWVNFLFRKPFSLSIADVGGSPGGPDRQIRPACRGVEPEDGAARLHARDPRLHCRRAAADFELAVAKSAAKPDLSLAASLTGASLRLGDEKVAVVEDVTVECRRDSPKASRPRRAAR